MNKKQKNNIIIKADSLSIGYGNFVLLDNISFNIKSQDIFIIMGASGCGKSSLLRCLTGLMPALEGTITIEGTDFTKAPQTIRNKIMQKCGILYQSGALFSSMTLAENISMPLQQYTTYSPLTIKELVSLKLSLVGLYGFEDFYPSEISGGMKKRAALARALALDPDILYCDEPSAGLDPISSKMLDDLIIELNDSLKTTFVVVTHELSSIFAIGTNSIFLDADSKSILGRGNPKDLLKNPPNQTIHNFLTRGNTKNDR